MAQRHFFLKLMRKLYPVFLIPLILSCSLFESVKDNGDLEFPNDSRVDRSFITKEPCEAPCWYGLNLEEATLTDIRETVSSLPFVDRNQVLEQKISNNSSEVLFLVHCVYSEPSENCVWLETSPEGKLRKIILQVLYPLRLRSVIEQLGIPDYYISDSSPTEDVCEIHMYWLNASIMANVQEGPKEKYCTGKGNMQISLDVQVESFIYTRINAQDIKKNGVPWTENQ